MAAFELGDRECGRGWQNAVARQLTFDPIPVPYQLGLPKVKSFVHERVSSSLVIFETWPAWFLVTRTTCTNGEKVTAKSDVSLVSRSQTLTRGERVW